MEVQRPALVLAQRLVIELAQNVARDIPYHEPHDLFVDPSITSVERVTNRLVERGGRQTGAGERRGIDPAAGPRNGGGMGRPVCEGGVGEAFYFGSRGPPLRPPA